MSTTRTKSEMLTELRTMLHDVLVAREQGQTAAKLGRAHGYVDGYMKALLDSGMATKKELLDVVAGERERVSGPAMRAVDEVRDSAIRAA